MLTLSSAHSGSSSNRLPLQHISTRALAISALLPFDSGVLATGWILNWVAIQVSLDLIANAAFALLQLWVMNITPSNVQHSWIYRSSVTSMFHPNRSSSLWCLTFLSQPNATSHSSHPVLNYVRSTPSPPPPPISINSSKRSLANVQLIYYINYYTIHIILYYKYSLSNIGYLILGYLVCLFYNWSHCTSTIDKVNKHILNSKQYTYRNIIVFVNLIQYMCDWGLRKTECAPALI